jgi:hypothetical protein
MAATPRPASSNLGCSVMYIHAPVEHGKALLDAMGGWTKRAFRTEATKSDFDLDESAPQAEYAQQLATFADGGANAKPRNPHGDSATRSMWKSVKIGTWLFIKHGTDADVPHGQEEGAIGAHSSWLPRNPSTCAAGCATPSASRATTARMTILAQRGMLVHVVPRLGLRQVHRARESEQVPRLQVRGRQGRRAGGGRRGRAGQCDELAQQRHDDGVELVTSQPVEPMEPGDLIAYPATFT